MNRINLERPLTKLERNQRYYALHKNEESQRGQKYREENRDKESARGIRYQHGVTPEWVKEKSDSQQNKCAICRKPFTKTPHIDHNHECCSTRKTCGECNRGLLCDDCNLGLGRFKDSIVVLSNAIQY